MIEVTFEGLSCLLVKDYQKILVIGNIIIVTIQIKRNINVLKYIEISFMVESVVNWEVFATFGGSWYSLIAYTFDPINGKCVGVKTKNRFLF